MSVPSMTTDPLSGLSRPMIVLSSTDLPVPDGPSITQISPGGTVNVTSPQISCLPKDLVSPSISIATPIRRALPSTEVARRSLCGHRPATAPHSPVTTAVTRRSYAEPMRLAPRPRPFRALRAFLPYPSVSVWKPGVPRNASAAAPMHGDGRCCGREIRRRCRLGSLDGDGGAGALESVLGLVRLLLVDAFEDRLRRGLDEVLGLLQAEGCQRAHLLDDVDLLVAGGLEDHVERVLLGGRVVATGGSAARGRRRGDGD